MRKMFVSLLVLFLTQMNPAFAGQTPSAEARLCEYAKGLADDINRDGVPVNDFYSTLQANVDCSSKVFYMRAQISQLAVDQKYYLPFQELLDSELCKTNFWPSLFFHGWTQKIQAVRHGEAVWPLISKSSC